MKNMSFIVLAFLFSSTIILIGCANEEFGQPIEEEEVIQDMISERETASIGWKVTCSGDCDCALEGALGDPTWVQCKCADCNMNIEIEYANGKIEIQEVSEGRLEVPYFNDFEIYMAETYVDQEYSLEAVEVVEAGEESTYSFIYSLQDGRGGDVLFAQAAGEKWTVDCSGGCDCRSVFTFSTPPSASCSCDDCTLVATNESQSPTE